MSGWISGLEDQFGVVLFDRSGRFPKLTPEGVLLLADARGIVSGVNTDEGPREVNGFRLGD